MHVTQNIYGLSLESIEIHRQTLWLISDQCCRGETMFAIPLKMAPPHTEQKEVRSIKLGVLIQVRWHMPLARLLTELIFPLFLLAFCPVD